MLRATTALAGCCQHQLLLLTRDDRVSRAAFKTAVVYHMHHQSVGRRVLGITRHQLFLVFTEEEVEEVSRLIAHDLHVRILHEQFPEPEDAALMVNICVRLQRRVQFGRVPPGIEDLNDFVILQMDLDNMSIHVRRRGQSTRQQDHIVAFDSQTSHRFVVYQFGQVGSKQVQQTLDG